MALAALDDAGAPDAAEERLQRLLHFLEADGGQGASGAGRGAATALRWENFEGGGSDVLVKDALLALAEQEEAWGKLMVARDDRAIAAAQQDEFDRERLIEILRDAPAARAAAARKQRVASVSRAAVPHSKAKAAAWLREHREAQGPLSCEALNYGAPSLSNEVKPDRARRDGIKWPQWVETPGRRAAKRAEKKARAQRRQRKKDPNFLNRTSKRPANNKGKGSAEAKRARREAARVAAASPFREPAPAAARDAPREDPATSSGSTPPPRPPRVAESTPRAVQTVPVRDASTTHEPTPVDTTRVRDADDAAREAAPPAALTPIAAPAPMPDSAPPISKATSSRGGATVPPVTTRAAPTTTTTADTTTTTSTTTTTTSGAAAVLSGLCASTPTHVGPATTSGDALVDAPTDAAAATPQSDAPAARPAPPAPAPVPDGFDGAAALTPTSAAAPPADDGDGAHDGASGAAPAARPAPPAPAPVPDGFDGAAALTPTSAAAPPADDGDGAHDGASGAAPAARPAPPAPAPVPDGVDGAAALTPTSAAAPGDAEQKPGTIGRAVRKKFAAWTGLSGFFSGKKPAPAARRRSSRRADAPLDNAPTNAARAAASCAAAPAVPAPPTSTQTPAAADDAVAPVTTDPGAPDDAPTRAAIPFRLTAGGRELIDCRTLASYGIKPGTTIDCLLALRGGAPTADGPGAPVDDPVDAAPQALPRATAAPHHGEALQEPASWPHADGSRRGAPPPSAPRDGDGRLGTRSEFEARGLRHDDQRGGATHASRDGRHAPRAAHQGGFSPRDRRERGRRPEGQDGARRQHRDGRHAPRSLSRRTDALREPFDDRGSRRREERPRDARHTRLPSNDDVDPRRARGHDVSLAGRVDHGRGAADSGSRRRRRSGGGRDVSRDAGRRKRRPGTCDEPSRDRSRSRRDGRRPERRAPSPDPPRRRVHRPLVTRKVVSVTVALADESNDSISVVFQSPAVLLEPDELPRSRRDLYELARASLSESQVTALERRVRDQSHRIMAEIAGRWYGIVHDGSFAHLAALITASADAVVYAYCVEPAPHDFLVDVAAACATQFDENEAFATEASYFWPGERRAERVDDQTRRAERAARRIRCEFPNGTQAGIEWSATRPTPVRPLRLTPEVPSAVRFLLASDAAQRLAPARLVAGPGHVAFYFEAVGEGRVQVKIARDGAYVIWKDLSDLHALRETLERALCISPEDAIAIAPTPYTLYCPFCGGPVARRTMNDLSKLLQHLGTCRVCGAGGEDARRRVRRLERLSTWTSFGLDEATAFPRPSGPLARAPRPSQVLRLVAEGSSLTHAAFALDALQRAGVVSAAHPMVERVAVFANALGGARDADPGWRRTESLAVVEARVARKRHHYPARGGAGRSLLGHRCPPTRDTAHDMNDVVLSDAQRRSAAFQLISESGPFPSDFLRAYLKIFSSLKGTVVIDRDGVRVSFVTLQWDGVPVTPDVGVAPPALSLSDEQRRLDEFTCVGFVPAVSGTRAREFLDAVRVDPDRAVEALLRDHQRTEGVDYYHVTSLGGCLALPFVRVGVDHRGAFAIDYRAKFFTGARGSGIARDVNHLAQAMATLVICDACRGDPALEAACARSRSCADCFFAPPTADAAAVDVVCGPCGALGITTADPRRRRCERCRGLDCPCVRFGCAVSACDGEHAAHVDRANSYVDAVNDVARRRAAGEEDAVVAAHLEAEIGGELAALLRAERTILVVDFVHSARRLWGKFIDYSLKSGDEMVSTRLMLALRGSSPGSRELWAAHLSSKAAFGRNRLASALMVEACRQGCEELVRRAGGVVTTVAPERYTPWTQNLGHAHVCEPCAVACATKSTIVFALNASGKIVALNNHWPNRCFVVAGGHHAAELSEVWPQPGMGGRYAPSRLRLHKPSGLTLLGEDRFMIVVDRSLKCALFVVEYPWRWSPSQATRVFRLGAPRGCETFVFVDVAAVGAPASNVQRLVLAVHESAEAGSLMVVEAALPLRPAAVFDVKRRVGVDGLPRQVCVSSVAAFATVHAPDGGYVAMFKFAETNATATRLGRACDEDDQLYGITIARIDDGTTADRRVVVSTLEGEQLLRWCTTSGAFVPLAGECGRRTDQDGTLKDARFSQPMGLATSTHAQSTFYVACNAGSVHGSIRQVNVATAGLRKFLRSLRALCHGCGLPDALNYVRRNLETLGYADMDAYHDSVFSRPFRTVLAEMRTAIEAVEADVHSMGDALSRNHGRRRATQGPEATADSNTVRRFAEHLDRLRLHLFPGLQHATGLGAAELDAILHVVDVVTTRAERWNAKWRQDLVNASAAELGTAGDVVALEARAIEDTLLESVRTPFSTQSPNDRQSYYTLPDDRDGGVALETLLTILAPLRRGHGATRPLAPTSSTGTRAQLMLRTFFPRNATMRPKARYQNAQPYAGNNMFAQAPRLEGGAAGPAVAQGRGMRDVEDELGAGLEAAAPPVATEAVRLAQNYAAGQVIVVRAPGSPHDDYCHECEGIDDLVQCQVCARSYCARHSASWRRSRDSGPFVCPREHTSLMERDFLCHCEEVQSGFSFYLVTRVGARGATGLYMTCVGPPPGATDEPGDLFLLGREPGSRVHAIKPEWVICDAAGQHIDVASTLEVVAPNDAPERHRLPAEHARRVRELVDALGDGDGGESQDDEGENDGADDEADDEADDDDVVGAARRQLQGVHVTTGPPAPLDAREARRIRRAGTNYST